MNRQRYRIVFNKARGQRMAVAETACSQGKSPNGEMRSPASAIHTVALRPLHAVIRIAFAAGMASGLLPVATAQIIADSTAPANQRPTVLVSNGQPLVNIQTPSAAGISRNTYSQFDVQSNGTTLNNSRQSNPWLATGEAKVILNEVNSSNPSYLNGTITVSGARAQVIVANPSGIQLDGASFINASRATLTTGTAVMNNDAVQGFNVSQGTVVIKGKGLNATDTSYTDILSRAAVISGVINANANELNITTGTQNVDYTTGETKAIAGTGAAPSFAIDTGALGGMYAGKITLLATEAGVGVRNAGILGYNGGQLVLTADGTLQNTGSMNAKVISLATVTGDIYNSGTINSSQLLMASSGRDLTLYGDGGLEGGGLQQGAGVGPTVLLNAQRNFSNDGMSILSEGVGGQIGISAGGNISMTNSQLWANGNIQISSGGRIDLKYQGIQSAVGNASLLATTGIDIFSSNINGKQVGVETGAIFKETNAPISLRNSSIKGLTNATVISSGSLGIDNGFINGGEILNVAAKGDANFNGTSFRGGNYSLGTGGTINIESESNLSLNRSNVLLWNTGQIDLLGGSVDIAGSSVIGYKSTSYQLPSINLNITATKTNLTARTIVGGTYIYQASTPSSISTSGAMRLSSYGGEVNLNGISANADSISVVAASGVTIKPYLELFQKTYYSEDPGYAPVVYSTATEIASKLTAKSDITLVNLNSKKSLNIYSANIKATGGDVMLASAGAIDIKSQTSAGTYYNPYALETATVYYDDIPKFGFIKYNIPTTVAAITASNKITLSSGSSLNWDSLARFRTSDLSITTGAGGFDFLSRFGESFNHDQYINDKYQYAYIDSISRSLSINTPGAISTYGWDRGYKLPALQSLSLKGSSINVSNQDFSTDGNLSFIATVDGVYLPSKTFINSGDLNIYSAAGDVSGSFYNAGNLNAVAKTGNVSINGSIRSKNVDVQGMNIAYGAGNANIAGNMSMTAFSGDIVAINSSLANIAVGGNFNMTASNNIQMQGVSVSANNLLTMQAGNTIDVSSSTQSGNSADGTERWRYNTKSQLSGLGGVSIGGNNIYLTSTSVASGNGKITLNAFNDIDLAATQDWYYKTWSTSGSSSTWYGYSSSWSDNYLHESSTTVKSSLNAQYIDIKAGNNFTAQAANISTEVPGQSTVGAVTLYAGNQANYYAVKDAVHDEYKHEESSNWLGFIGLGSSSNFGSTMTNSPVVTQLQSSGTFQSYSGGDQTYQGTQVITQGGLDVQAGVGEKARADARIILEGVKTTVQTAQTSQSNYVLWQKLSGQGSTVETMALPTFLGGVKFSAPGGIDVQIAAGDFTAQVASLATQPDMGYLSDLAQRKDVNWQPVKLAFDQWSYQQEGLTPAGAALVAVAVAWATGGMGAELVGATGSTTSLMANAAFTSIASQASITLINNKGDVGKTLKDLGSSSTVKAALAAVLTAGVLDKIGALPGMAELKDGAAFSDKLTYNLINASGRALTNTAINGGSLEDALKAALVGGIVDTAHGAAASQIKDMEADYIAHKLAHALAGCVAGAAAGGACQDGAIGAAVGEMVAEMMPPANGAFFTDAEKAKVLAYSKIVAGGAAAYAGGNAQTAITTAETAVTNNYLTDTQKQQRDRAIAACKTLACAVGVKLKYDGASAKQDVGLMVGVVAGIGYQSAEQALALVDLAKNFRETLTALAAIVNDPEFRAKVGNQMADDYRQRIDMQTRAYNEGGWGGSVTAGVEAGRLAVDVVALAAGAVGTTKIAAKVASVGGAAVVDAATQLALKSAAVFDSLDAASQTRWLTQTSGWRAATTELAELESQAGGMAHPLLRHGDQVELSQLLERATTGMTPDGMSGLIVNSTRWLKNEDMLEAVKQAQNRYAVGDYGTGTASRPAYTIIMGKVVGDGYYRSSSTYATSSQATVWLKSDGLPITAFPKLP